MIIHTFEHRNRCWNVVVHPDAGPVRDCGLELVFVALDEPAVKYSRAVQSSTLDLIATTPASLSTITLLRAFLDRAMRENT
ncbi:MAG TPA: hypothetical protein VMM35_06410 [Longimicrobiales bacterium]|nr:hypothetical protein [Longimicrobiales bacterium]